MYTFYIYNRNTNKKWNVQIQLKALQVLMDWLPSSQSFYNYCTCNSSYTKLIYFLFYENLQKIVHAWSEFSLTATHV